MSEKVIEAVADVLAGHFGPPMNQLPVDRIERRAWQRKGIDPGHTQDEVREAARATNNAHLAWLEANGFAVVPVKHLRQIDATAKAHRDMGIAQGAVHWRTGLETVIAMIAAAKGDE